MTATADHHRIDRAIEDFDRALRALLDAERERRPWTATLALADEVIATRVRAHTELMRAGWEPPSTVVHDLVTDQLIVELVVQR